MQIFKKLTMAVLSALLLTTVACGKSNPESAEQKVARLQKQAETIGQDMQAEALYLQERYGIANLTIEEIKKVPLQDLPAVLDLLLSLRGKGLKAASLLQEAHDLRESYGEYTPEKSEKLSELYYAEENLNRANEKAEKLIQFAEQKLAEEAKKQTKAANQ